MCLGEASEKRLQETSTTEINDGTRDISAVPSRFLLLRQLDHLTTEESIYSAVQTLQGVYRTILIRDKLTKMSCEFAFVEFFDVQSASLALDYATQSLTIDGRKVSASFATEESFIPVYGETEWTITSVNPLEGLKAYWDKALYGTEYSKAIEDERRQKEEEQKQAKEREEELKRKEAEAKSKKNTLEDDLNDFYASMGDFDTDSTSKSDIFSVPKSY
ncbi:hypothetical protein BDF20DRAFT_686579 [Mycotypha africana]|uniref:uncharacterized protein n=1 Tax=Mycotypha africana TaxID=64632 RepID=UPI00230110DC|nr:uncharacterized protein BDF20DRAFT_686579 [Mycotypha africana]KAI8971577.1 hypothetical protein BDF20DRAFT_686579 [Mycotypha africana]